MFRLAHQRLPADGRHVPLRGHIGSRGLYRDWPVCQPVVRESHRLRGGTESDEEGLAPMRRRLGLLEGVRWEACRTGPDAETACRPESRGAVVRGVGPDAEDGSCESGVLREPYW